MVTLTIEATIPDALLQQLLQHLRDFDLWHDPQREGRVHLEIGVEAPGLPAAAVHQVFNSIRPPFDHKIVMQGKAEA